MTITFFTNLIHHHQVPVADEFYRQLGHNYTFVICEVMPQFLIDGGYPDNSDKIYLLDASKSDKNFQKALKLAIDSDVVINGGIADIFLKERLKTNKITFRYEERFFKKIDYRIFSPRGWYYRYLKHTQYRNKNLYLLCAGAYTANDANKIFAYPNKKFKWGYFTKVEDLNIDKVILEKPQERIEILWVARFLDWKRPEFAVKLAQALKSKGYKFHLSMVGSGYKYEEISNLVKTLNLDNCVTVLGNMPNNAVRQLMIKSNIFIFTSNREEGWGAVLNEAMSSGCAVVASHKIGAVPYLVDNGNNGLVFNSSNFDGLIKQTERLLKDKPFREAISKKAYQTILNEWSSKNAVNNFLKLIQAINNSETSISINGPCSIAENISNNFYSINH